MVREQAATAFVEHDHANQVLSPQAVDFLLALHRAFEGRRKEILAARVERQVRFDAGERPDFLTDTAHVRESDWTVPPAPPGLVDRRVEITGPVDRKMMI